MPPGTVRLTVITRVFQRFQALSLPVVPTLIPCRSRGLLFEQTSDNHRNINLSGFLHLLNHIVDGIDPELPRQQV